MKNMLSDLSKALNNIGPANIVAGYVMLIMVAAIIAEWLS